MNNNIKQVLLRSGCLLWVSFILSIFLLLVTLLLLKGCVNYISITHVQNTNGVLVHYLMLSPFMGPGDQPDDHDETWWQNLLNDYLSDPGYSTTRIPKNDPNTKVPIGGVGIHQNGEEYDFYFHNKELLSGQNLFTEIYASLLKNETYQAILKESDSKTLMLCDPIYFKNQYYFVHAHPFLDVDDSLTAEMYGNFAISNLYIISLREKGDSWFMVRVGLEKVD